MAGKFVFKYNKRAISTVLILSVLGGCVTIKQQQIGSDASAGTNNISPCEFANSKYSSAIIGAATVGIASYFLGEKKSTQALVGALAGGTIGFLIGKEMDDRRCDQWKIAQAANVPVKFDDVTELKIDDHGQKTEVKIGQLSVWPVEQQFETGSAVLTKQAERYFTDIAKTYIIDQNDSSFNIQERKELSAKRKQQVILLVGHTDDEGSSEANARLSESRALAVGSIFKNVGVSPANIYFQGAGEKFPIADNRSQDGRATNRRVEIIELDDEQALAWKLQHIAPKPEYYRASVAESEILINPSQHGSNTRDTELGITKNSNLDNSKTVTSDKINSKKNSNQLSSKDKSIDQTLQKNNNPLFIDFGGIQATINQTDIKSEMIGGKFQERDGLARIFGISTAIANDNVFTASCVNDHYRHISPVKNLADGKEFKYKTTDYVRGLGGSVYGGMVNGHLVVLQNLFVLQNEFMPVDYPNKHSEALVFKEYSGQKENNRLPDVTMDFKVNVYPGNAALLYRVFFDKLSSPLTCIDIIFPYKGDFTARQGVLHYIKSNQDYVSEYNPTITR